VHHRLTVDVLQPIISSGSDAKASDGDSIPESYGSNLAREAQEVEVNPTESTKQVLTTSYPGDGRTNRCGR
jgi:hypothetical protein